MKSSEWQLRSIRRTQKDRKALATFACANATIAWQAEVEDFVQNALFEWRFSPLAESNDPRVLLLFDKATEDLVGAAAHESVVMRTARGESFVATKLEVVAICRDWQGRAFGSGARASDVLMSGAMVDISARVPPRFQRVVATVHEDNRRSLALCRRHGFTEELDRVDELSSYRRLLSRAG